MNQFQLNKARLIETAGIAVNISLVMLKLALGFLSGSKALLADAVHSASTVGSNVVVAGSKRLSRSSNLGRGQAAMMIAVFVASVLIVMGMEIIIGALKAIFTGNLEVRHGYALIVVVGVIVVKEVLYQYCLRMGQRFNNEGLLLKAKDYRTGGYSSGIVLFGMGGAVLSEPLGMAWLLYLDPIAAIIVSVFILHKACKLILSAVFLVRDDVIQESETREIKQTIERVIGVITVDELHAREQGRDIQIELKISVNPTASVQDAHEIAKSVRHIVLHRFPRISDVFTYIAPYDPGYPYKVYAEPGLEDQSTLVH